MPLPITSQSSSKAGLCPHGLPPSACPICSGGAMGGAKMKDNAISKPKAHTNEWSYMKCLAEGLNIKARKVRAENAKTAFERQIEFAKQLNKAIENLSQKFQNLIQSIKDSVPKIITNLIQISADILIGIMSVLPKIIEKLAHFQQNISNFLQQAGEKLTSILGDLKNFINSKIIKNIKKIAKKLLLLIFASTEEENNNNDETLTVFKSRDTKKYIVNLIQKIIRRDKNATERSKANKG